MKSLETQIKQETVQLPGPILVFGAGGFMGSNLVRQLLKYRTDVYAVTSKVFIPWRLENIETKHILQCDITLRDSVEALFAQYSPKTVFNFAAYGAYSKQDIASKIYKTNFLGLFHLLETAVDYPVSAFVHAGSSSEYGFNCSAPDETDELQPNSHYAVSKAAAAQLVFFYGKVKKLPIVNLRFYSVYGPYEEPDRLVPRLIQAALNETYPPLVQPDISRDFIYIQDALLATLRAANSNYLYIAGESINIASGIRTTLKDMVNRVRLLFDLKEEPPWGEMPNRHWDLKNWYGKTDKARKLLQWEAQISLEQGLKETEAWQKQYSYPLYEKKWRQDETRHKITAVIACYRDAQAIPYMYERLKAVFLKLNVAYEIIFVNDASPDNTNEVLGQLVEKDVCVIGIEHSRNFGSQAAFLSGMEISTGDAVVLLDGDLQDPPELIESFFQKWQEEGYDVVYGRRVARQGNQWLAFFYKIFYRLFRSVSYIPIPLDAGDFSLMDRKVVNELIKMPETDQFLRGLRAWLGFKQAGVDYVRPERMFGTTTNNWRKNIAWARKAIFSFSFVPLELLSFAGWILTFISFIAIVFQITAYFFLDVPHGISTIVVLILFFGGINMLAISILGEYQAKILEETKKRPKFIRKSIIKKQRL